MSVGEVVCRELLQAHQRVAHVGFHLRLIADIAPQAVCKHLPAVDSCRQGGRVAGGQAGRRMRGQGERGSRRNAWQVVSAQQAAQQQQASKLLCKPPPPLPYPT